MKNVFNENDKNDFVNRINALTPSSKPKWGKMNAGQMLAHCNVTYEMVYENIHPKPNFIICFLLKLFVKNGVVNDKPYKKSIQTAPQFIIKSEKDFQKEKQKLIDYLEKTCQHGESYFDSKISHSFGKLNKTEWNNLFSKHLDHHLKQFDA